MENLDMINKIKESCIAHRKLGNKTLYLLKKDQDISIIFQFIGNQYCQYMDYALNSIGWTMDTIDNFYKHYIVHINDFLEYQEISSRRYGEPKLIKPIELKGLKHTYSIINGVRKNQIFIKNNDIWIKDNDYFSTYLSQEKAKELGLKFNIKKKFVYNDNYGPIVLRGEGWLCIKNLLLYIEDCDIEWRLTKKICSFYHWDIGDFVGDIEIFYNILISKLKQAINRKELKWV